MCGIAGRVDFAGRPGDPEWLDRACALLAHRGPDGQAIWRTAKGTVAVGLAHRRLKVIDLARAADQPMHNRGCVRVGRAAPLTVVFNGEIYNFQTLRQELEAAGHCFETRSDTEVLLHLYEEFGVACVDRLRGMFAFAIWDAEHDRLFCARDRLGKKPFYYRWHDRTFWFASEPAALLADPGVPAAGNPAALASYLALGYVPAPSSAFHGIERLLPAHTLTVTVSGPRARRYWRLEYEPKRSLSEEDARAELDFLLREAVRLRLVSDVPLGAFLSGGLDSSAVVAIMADQAPDRVRTFSIGFESARYDERPFAREIAARYGTEHHEFVVRPDAAALAPPLARHYGEPYADSSAIPTFCLAQLARQHITVALNGDGGDETFGGYARYRANLWIERFAHIPRPLRSTLSWLASHLAAKSSRSTLYDIRRFLVAASQPVHVRYASWFGLFADHSILSDDFRRTLAEANPLEPLARAFSEFAHLHPIDRCIAADVTLYLPDDLLVKVDIATMAHGLEARSPLLDHVLMEFAARLPVSLKARGISGKHLLRKWLAGRVPARILGRRKTGFGVPLDGWFRNELKDFAHDVLLDPRTRQRGLTETAVVRRLLAEHSEGRAAHGHRLWALVMLELWHRELLDRRPVMSSLPAATAGTGDAR